MKLKDKIQYVIIAGVCYGLAFLPLWMLYLLSDFTAWLAHSIVRYRRKVVRDNLESSFPEKSDRDLKKIEKGFYRFLADYGVETLKMLTMSKATMSRRLILQNQEPVCNAIDKGRNVILFLGHYCNWEWVSSLPLHFPKRMEGCQVYHYLHNKAMDKLFMKIRTRFGAQNIEMGDIFRKIIGWKRHDIPVVCGLIADQVPHLDLHLFLDFLNHETGVYTGPERIARFLDAEVWYCHLTRPRRGYYTLRFEPVTLSPTKEPLFDITRRCFALLEANIREAPQYWLWSHRRWKRGRAEFMEYWGDKAEQQLSHL